MSRVEELRRINARLQYQLGQLRTAIRCEEQRRPGTQLPATEQATAAQRLERKRTKKRAKDQGRAAAAARAVKNREMQQLGDKRAVEAVRDVNPAAGGGTRMRLRPQFGDRLLESTDRVFEQNAWDNVEMDEDQIAAAEDSIASQAANPVSEEDKALFATDAGRFWNEFYTKHENKFFKDRHWLFTEFEELIPAEHAADNATGRGPTSPPLVFAPAPAPAPTGSAVPAADGAGPAVVVVDERWAASAGATRRVIEVGCGVGNTVFPLLESNKDPGLFVYACDFSSHAVGIVRATAAERGESKRCCPFVCDVSQQELGLPANSLDVVVMIFVLSAVQPDQMQAVVNKLVRCLKPGGTLLFRDYGRFDLAQLRFKKNRYLAENFYARGDGTQVYFFSQEEFRAMMARARMVEKQCRFDKRLIVNRARRVTMHRVWLQCKYTKR